MNHITKRILWLVASLLSFFPPVVIVKSYVERNFYGSMLDLIFSLILWFVIIFFCVYKTLFVKVKSERKKEIK